MVLISLGQLKEQLELDKGQRRFSFEELVASAELQRLTNEAHASIRWIRDLAISNKQTSGS